MLDDRLRIEVGARDGGEVGRTGWYVLGIDSGGSISCRSGVKGETSGLDSSGLLSLNFLSPKKGSVGSGGGDSSSHTGRSSQHRVAREYTLELRRAALAFTDGVGGSAPRSDTGAFFAKVWKEGTLCSRLDGGMRIACDLLGTVMVNRM